MGQIKFVTNIALATLFAIAMITYAINFGIDNDSPINIQNDTTFTKNLNSSKTQIGTNYYESVRSSDSAFFNASVDEGGEITRTGGEFKVVAANPVTAASDVAEISFKKIFGGGEDFAIFFWTFIGILSFATIAYVWKTWRGNPD